MCVLEDGPQVLVLPITPIVFTFEGKEIDDVEAFLLELEEESDDSADDESYK